MRIQGAVAAMLVTLAAVGCGVENGPGSGAQESTRPAPAVRSVPPEPKAEPVASPVASKETPDGLTSTSSVNRTSTFSESGEERVDAENFAVAFAQLMIDTREDRDQESLVDDLTSDQLPSQVRDFLLVDYWDLRELGAGRHMDASYPAAVRSELAGSEVAPTRVNVELVAVAASAWDDSLALIRVRVDVAREGDRWQVVDFGGPTMMGPWVEKPSDVLDNLDGTGWRQLPS